MKLEMNEDMFGDFGESDGTLFQKPCILKVFELYATNRRGGCEGTVRSKDCFRVRKASIRRTESHDEAKLSQ